MVSAVIDALELKPTDRVLDFFSGLGNFTLPVAKKAGQVLAIEVIDEMVQKSLTNAQNNQLDNVDAVARDLFDTSALEWLDQGADKVILDPPRAGAELISQQLGRTQAKRVAYVSCNPQSLARDAQYILQQGYRLECLTLLDMFPQTSHVETLAIFSK
jgi:23S rRNA (uracil1939-C5)-methyltransferase